MKKIIASAVGLMMLGGVAVTTANAFESKFGGYWRTRVFSQTDFNGVDSSYNRVDNRTRLYYTAIFNEDFKFVNKFEFNTNWGDNKGGDIGSDGMGIFRIKNSYADFTLGNVNTKLGIQGAAIARGFIFDDDFSGVNIKGNFGAVSPTFMWIRVAGEYVSDLGSDDDVFAALVPFKIGDMTTLNPYFVYRNSDKANEDYYIGIDADMNFDVASAWGTFIYQGGTKTDGIGDDELFDFDVDNAGYLFAVGAKASIVHGQFFYASGDDSPGDADNDQFAGVKGRSYYWSEIMGLGTFDNQTSNGSPANGISNIWAANIGVKAPVGERWTLGADLWYANLAEDDVYGNDELGTEVDLKATYKVFDNMSLDLVGAYLFAGDATGTEDPVEIGARLSLKF
ncbi:MAG: hypothetical protein JRC69_09235 [Deltaproteobacteria bacterium]|nr:hypothetical protein [Deltaproteobacteria bacterium]